MVFVSDSANAGDGGGPRTASAPRALIHKKILEQAASMPEATMAEVADEVSGASTDLVERVLAEYGDPASGGSDSDSGAVAADVPEEEAVDAVDGTSDQDRTPESPDGPSGAEDPVIRADGSAEESAKRADDRDAPAGESASASGSDAPPETEQSDDHPDKTRTAEPQTGPETMTADTAVQAPEELSEKELAVLEVVADRPDATQEEIADVLGVSRATISKRASGIDGFDWQRRAAFVERLFGDESAALTRGGTDASTVPDSSLEPTDARTDGDRHRPGGRDPASVDTADHGEVVARLDRIESRLDALESGDAASTGIADPTLAHKVVHACMESDKVSESEELRVVSAVLNGDGGD